MASYSRAALLLGVPAALFLLCIASAESTCVNDGSGGEDGAAPSCPDADAPSSSALNTPPAAPYTLQYPGLKYATWEGAPSSADEFDHDNDPSVCRLQIISVEEWEEGRYWEYEEPVIVRGVTEGWNALEHWTK